MSPACALATTRLAVSTPLYLVPFARFVPSRFHWKFSVPDANRFHCERSGGTRRHRLVGRLRHDAGGNGPTSVAFELTAMPLTLLTSTE